MPRGNSTPILSPDSWGASTQHVLSLRVSEQTESPEDPAAVVTSGLLFAAPGLCPPLSLHDLIAHLWWV